MTRPIPPDVLARAAAILDGAQPGRVIPAVLACPDRDVRLAAVLAVDLEGGNPQRAAAELRRVAGTNGAERAARR